MDTSVGSREGMETDARLEVIGDAVLGLCLGFAFGGVRGEAGRGVIVVVYSGMSCEFV